MQNTAYGTLVRAARQQVHARIGAALEQQSPEVAQSQPELLAHHYTEARQPERALPLWHKAGDLALRRSAYIEAAAHLERALSLIEELDANSAQRTLQVPLQITYGNVLRMARGFGAPETIAAFARAQELAAAIKDAPERLVAQYGLWSGSFVRGELAMILEVSGAFLHCVEGRPESPEAGIAHRICGLSSWFQGDFIGAQAHLEQALAIYDSDRDRELAFRFGQDVGVSAMAYLALVLWPFGAIDRARQLAERAVTHAIQTKHIPTVAYVHAHKSVFEMMCHDGPQTVPHAEALVDLAREHGMPWWLANGTFFQGWARWKAGEHERGTAEMQKGMALVYEQHQHLFVPLLATLAAEAEAEEGRLEAGLGTIDAQLGRIEQTGQRWFLAEVHRARGEIALKHQPGDASEAESAFMRAIDIARSQSAKLFELRAATRLARLWAARGKSAEARGLLAPIYGWFTEGFGTKDLKEAKALLDELG